ncbi:hypothetical protein N9Q89_03190 [Flavobacteriaceae bacterium]|nr:hypothetical protein [Flavobacteriaceae bacterium]
MSHNIQSIIAICFLFLTNILLPQESLFQSPTVVKSVLTSAGSRAVSHQSLYNSMADAIAAIGSEAFVTEPSIKANGMLRGFLIIQKGTVALNNPLNAKFIEASRIAGTAGASSASSGLLEVVPLWKSNTDGGLYQSNDILNFNGYLYKNLTGANTDTTPENDTVNWVKTIDLAIQLSDADGDTKIEVEQAADEDIIRFTTAGTERLRINGSRIIPTNSNFSVFIGENAGTDVVSISNNNVFIGRNTGSSIDTGSGNVGIGSNAMAGNDAGANNTAIGVNSLQSNQNATGLVAVGARALLSNTSGIQNVALGLDALKSNTTGAYNIGIGPNAGRYIADGSTPRETRANSIYIGKDTKARVDGTLNEIVIGTNVFGKGDNTITLGNGASTELHTAADIISKRFHTIWKSSVNIYAVNAVVIYNGALYKNLTGSNTAVAPDADTTNWKEIGVEGSVVPLWKSQTNGGSYATSDIINYSGMLYKNLTGTNSDTTPNLDTTNWSLVTKNLGTTVTINNGILLRPNWPSIGFNLGLNSNNQDIFFTINPSYRIIEPNTGAEAGLLQIKSTQNGIAGEVRKFPEYPETTIVEVNKDGDIEVTGELKTATFSSAWINSTNGGVYAINDIVLYNGGIYKNLTGSNLDTTPNTDATNWETIALGSSYEYLVARSDQGNFTANVDQLYPFSIISESDGSSITPPPTLQNGRYNLAPNGTYRLTADVGVISGSGDAHWRFYNDTDANYIGNSSTASQNGNDTTDSNGATCHAIIRTGASSVQISVRKANGTAGTLHYATGSRAIARLFIERIR